MKLQFDIKFRIINKQIVYGLIFGNIIILRLSFNKHSINRTRQITLAYTLSHIAS